MTLNHIFLKKIQTKTINIQLITFGDTTLKKINKLSHDYLYCVRSKEKYFTQSNHYKYVCLQTLLMFTNQIW